MATGIAIAAAIVAAAGAAVLGITHRRKRVERAELVRSWAVAFAAAVGADSRNHGALPAIDDQLRKAGPGDEDLAIFLERGLDERIDEARAARALVLELGPARIRDAATDVGKLPEPLRDALFEEILRDVDELPAAPPARPDISTVEVAVRYLELIQDGAVRAYNAAGRLFVLRVILTVLLLAVAAGIAKVDPKDLPWFGLELDPAEVLVGSSVFVSVLQFLDVLHYERGHQLSVRAVRLYAELGFPAPRAEWKSPENPLRLQYAAAVTNEPSNDDTPA